MKKLLFGALLFLFITHTAAAQEKCPIIPLPQSYQQTNSTFRLTNQTAIVLADPTLQPVAYFLQKEILKQTGQTLAILPKKQAGPQIILQVAKSKQAQPEAYQLTIAAEKIEINAAQAHGAFNGAISLLQLIKQTPLKENTVVLAGCKITDAPALAWRGLMLDESRHFFGKETVKTLLDWMAFYKLNRFHWHLTDAPGWRLEIKGYPRLNLVGGVGNHSNPNAAATYYTQEDIKEIVAYAAERFIEVIPEIDMPGHAAAANKAYPEFSGGGSARYPDFTFNPGKEDTYSYLTKILRETDVLFPGKKIHLGGDEVHFGNEKWKTDTHVQQLMQTKKLPDLKAVEFYFIKRMADSLARINSKILAWDEVVPADLPVENTIIFWWRHNLPDQLKTALAKGYQVVMCPRIPFYFDFVQDANHLSGRKWQGDYSSLEKLYAFSLNSYPSIITEKNRKQILGFQGALWTETIASEARLEYMLFPRISALAEATWTTPEKKNFDAFKGRMAGHFKLYQQAGLQYYNPLQPNSRPEIVDIFENKAIE